MHDLRMVLKFAFHTIAAVALFMLVGGAAALLSIYTALLSSAGISPLIIKAIHLTEYFLFGVDLLCFMAYVARETWELIREILAPSVASSSPGRLVTDLPK